MAQIHSQGYFRALQFTKLLHIIALHPCVKINSERHLGGSVVEHLPLAQGVILGSRDQVLRRAPHREPAFLSASVSVSLMNK